MNKYHELIHKQYVIEIGDYIWSETSGFVQGEVFSILTTEQRKRTLVAYHVQRPDGQQFVIFAFDVKAMQKSEAWYVKVSELASKL